MNGAEGAVQIVEKVGPAPRQRGLPPDQNVVVTGFCGEWKDFGGSRAQTPLCPVADHGRADLAGYGKADAGRGIVAARARLEYEAGFRALAAAGGGKKLAALTQSPDLAVHPAHRGWALLYVR